MALKELDLEGKVAIVTGAGKGLGKAMALTLAEAGADITVAARTQADIEATAQEVIKLGRRALAIPTDVTKEDEVERMVKTTLAELGKVDILVNNAGAFVMKPVIPLPGLKTALSQLLPYFDYPTTVEEWNLVLSTNIIGTFLCVKAVGPYMIERKGGKIINISSEAATKAFNFYTVYSASKAAIEQFTRCLAVEWARYSINVNAIAPGYFRTDTTEFAYKDDALREHMRHQIPLRRFGDPRDIGLMAVYLASEASDYLTGQVIYCDGGLSV